MQTKKRKCNLFPRASTLFIFSGTFRNQKLSFEVERIDYQGCIVTKKVAVMCKICHQCCLEHLSAAIISQIVVHMGFVVLNRKKPLK